MAMWCNRITTAGISISALLAMFGFAGAAAAATYNATSQFSTTQNTDKRTWSYRISDGLGHDGNYALLTHIGTYSATKSNHKPVTLKDWDTPTAPFNVPLFYANKTSTPLTIPSNSQQVTVPAKTMTYHPGAANVAAVLSFLAPKAGTAMISYNFTHIDGSCGGSGAGIDWSIEKNSGHGALANGHLRSPDLQHIDSTGAQQVSVAVVRGDRINFLLDGTANPPNCASTSLAAAVTLP